MGNDTDDGRSSSNLSNTRFTKASLLQANTSTAMTSLLTLRSVEGELVSDVTTASGDDLWSESEIEVGGESRSNLAAKGREGKRPL